MLTKLNPKNAFIEKAISLGEQVEKEWSTKDYDPLSLVPIAAEALRESRIQESFNFDEFVRHFCQITELPEQLYPKDGFGKPSITLFRKNGLAVDLYFWDHVDTSIHSHGFSGAFMPIYGRSLHSEYSFIVSDGEMGKDTLVLGELKPINCNVANTGQVIPIVHGSSFIHQVIHFETPAVTFLVRNLGSVKQYNYRAGLCYLHAPEPVITVKHSNLLKLLARMKHPEGANLMKSVIEEYIKNGENYVAIKFFLDHYALFLKLEEVEEYLSSISGLARWQNGLINSMQETEERKMHPHRIPDAESRFLASALLNVTNWSDMERVLKQYTTKYDPRDFIRLKLEPLLRQGGLSVSLNDMGLKILLWLFDGKSEAEIVEEIAKEFDVSDTNEVRKDVAELRSEIESIQILRGLF